MTGGGGGHSEVAQAPAQAPQQYQQPQQQQSEYPCQMELKQFLECSQNQSDISLCYGFNEALKECRMRSGGRYTCHVLSQEWINPYSTVGRSRGVGGVGAWGPDMGLDKQNCWA